MMATRRRRDKAWPRRPKPLRPRQLAGAEAGRINNRGYRQISLLDKQYYAHRLAWAWVHNAEPPRFLDHIDRNKLNNAVDNLRDGTGSVNLVNRQFGAITGVKHNTGEKLGKNGRW